MGRLIRQVATRAGQAAVFREWTYTRTGAVREERVGTGINNATHTITNSYDAQGRLVTRTETGGIRHNYRYNAANNRTHHELIINNVRHLQTESRYDIAQRLEFIVEPPSAVQPHRYVAYRYTYDANGRIMYRSSHQGPGFSTMTAYTRNLAGLVTHAISFNRYTGEILSEFLYEYYIDGNIRQVTERLQGVTRTITYSYDLARRLTQEQETGYRNITRAYTFDARGNRARMTVTGAETYTVTYHS
jgi:YD repeat-containing protein